MITRITSVNAKKMAMVYVLNGNNGRRVYVGSTVDVSRRIRQHNGLLSGGAKRTRSCRPWTLGVLLWGFRDRNQALRFEWLLAHPSGRRSSVAKSGADGVMRRVAELITKLEWSGVTIGVADARFGSAAERIGLAACERMAILLFR